MASLAYGFIRPCSYFLGYKDLVDARFRSEFDKQNKNMSLKYNPYSEIVGTLVIPHVSE